MQTIKIIGLLLFSKYFITWISLYPKNGKCCASHEKTFVPFKQNVTGIESRANLKVKMLHEFKFASWLKYFSLSFMLNIILTYFM